MEAAGCALCLDTFAHGKLTPRDLEVIHPLLSSALRDPSVVFTLRETSSVFCDECENLLKETKRLHELLQTFSSQLNFLLGKVKRKYKERSTVRVTVEDKCDSESQSRQMGFSIDPEDAEEDESSVWVKEEEETEDDSSSSTEIDPLGIDLIGRGSRIKRQATNCDLNEFRAPEPPNKKLKSGKTFWPCLLCDLRFFAKGEKFLHEETVHLATAPHTTEAPMRLYSLICGKSAMTSADLSAHNETLHSSHLNFLCVSCDPPRKFFSEDLLSAHAVIHTSSVGPFPCSLCSPGSLTLESPSDLDSHLLRLHTHSIYRRVDCPPENQLKECANPPVTERRGGNKKPPPCRFCGFQVKTNGLFAVRLHERKEHAEKFIHLCSHASCRSTFAEEKEVRTCQESHRESPGQFKCFVCNGTFADGPTLREHLEAKHTAGGVKCDECQERVVFDWALRVHKAKLHGGEWPFKCPTCGKGAEHKFQVEQHIRVAHAEQDSSLLLSCDQCDRKFRCKSSLKAHKRKEHLGLGLFTCDECGKVLKSSMSFKIHKKAHLGIKDHVCHVCGTGFVNPAVLTMHLRVHTGEKPFVCHVCQKGFSQATPLKRHLDLHKKNGTWKEKPPKASSSAGP